jgi:hypothetical protein
VITTAEFLRTVAVIVSIVAAILFVRAITGGRKGRNAAYYSMRREAQRAANRTLSTSATLVVIAIGLVITSAVIPGEAPEPPPPPVIAAAATDTPSAQPTVYIVPTSTPTRIPVMNTPEPSPTLRPTAARIVMPTRPSNADLADKRLALRAICSQVDSGSAPLSPTTEFTRGVPTVYVFFDYHDVVSGTLVRHAWYKDGNSLHVDDAPWERIGAGSTYVSWSPGGGFEPGLYEVRVLLGNVKQFSANFMVK